MCVYVTQYGYYVQKRVRVSFFFFRRLFKYNISFRLLRSPERVLFLPTRMHTPTRPSESARTKDFGGYYVRILSDSMCVVFFFFCYEPSATARSNETQRKNPFFFFVAFSRPSLVRARFVGNGNKKKKTVLFVVGPDDDDCVKISPKHLLCPVSSTTVLSIHQRIIAIIPLRPSRLRARLQHDDLLFISLLQSTHNTINVPAGVTPKNARAALYKNG